MVKVALAGATGGFGRAVLRVFLNTPHGHELMVLSRNANPALSAAGVDVRAVDYASVESMTAALSGVHTVLSFIGGQDASVMETSQLSLLEAAKAAGVKRFAPSEYATSTNEGIDGYIFKERVWNAVKVSDLEYTKFSCGVFLNILGTGTPKNPSAGSEFKTGEEEALGGLRPWDFIINKKAGTADVPGDGNAKLALTDTADVGRFVLAALDLEKWPEELGMTGDSKSFNELIALVEQAQQRRFLIKYNSVEEMQDQIRQDEATRFYNQVRIQIAKGYFMVPNSLNKAFPSINPMTAEQYVEKWWGGVTDLGEPQWRAATLFNPA